MGRGGFPPFICQVDKYISGFSSLKIIKKDFLCEAYPDFLHHFSCAQETQTFSHLQACELHQVGLCCPRPEPHCNLCSEARRVSHCPGLSPDRGREARPGHLPQEGSC